MAKRVRQVYRRDNFSLVCSKRKLQFLHSVKDHSRQLNMTCFLRQLTSLSAGCNQIDHVLVFSNGLH